MDITEFAEQIVFGTTLEEKLTPPAGRLSVGRRPRQPIGSVTAPSRPYGLRMQPSGQTQISRPRDERLESESERGKLLHFLANHELLATELMALVLLKFPAAPHAFKRGVLVTLQEEQAHTQMYLNRMRECGVEFGTYPVSGQFWRIVEPMQSPIDFVSRLSLTFEQANLDYSQHFAKVFAKIGDQATASVLQQIYEDEIGHVQHGLHWFRQWKDPHKSDWDAYADSLDFPMSPQRARAPKIKFNRTGRQQAGLSDDFINALEVFQSSRGRAATVRWFDAGVEYRLAGPPKPKTEKLIQQLDQDLAMVMLPLAKPDDLLLVDRMPPPSLRKHWIDSGFQLPEFRQKSDLQFLVDRKLHDCCPWAAGPVAQSVIDRLQPFLQKSPAPWNADAGKLYRKSWANQLFTESIDQTTHGSGLNFLCGLEASAIPVHAIEDFIAARDRLRRQGFSSLIFKPDLASSGRGQKRFATAGQLPGADRKWLQSKFDNRRLEQPIAVVEPELDRVLDFSMLWNLTAGDQRIVYHGWSQQIIGPGRRYLGSQLDKSLPGVDEPTKRFFLENKCRRINATAQWLENLILPHLRASGFHGPLGIDAFVFRTPDGLKIRPLIDLNPRHTMGHVALSLSKRLAGGAVGQFKILNRRQWSTMKPAAPLEVTAQGKWKAGAIRLGDLNADWQLMPIVTVQPSPKA